MIEKAVPVIVFLFFLIPVRNYAQKIVRYHLYVNDTTVNYTGKSKRAIAINGSIPAPALYFTEGDTAEIYVHNTMKRETSIHWHGLIVPNRYDGVPYLTTKPIKANTTYCYKFPIVQSGTYWYHSHTKLQEQSGMYGSLIIRKRNDPDDKKTTYTPKKQAKEYTMILSDWTDENPQEIHRSLHSATDWYAIKKGSTQNYFEAAKKGYLKTKFINEWKRMLAMDLSDVYYDRFFINGKSEDEQPQFKAGDKIKLRIINGSSSTYFWLQFAGSKLRVIASDGMDVVPTTVDRMIIGVAETYDILVTIPENKNYEFKATSEDRTGSVSLWLGAGKKTNAPILPTLNYFEGMNMMNGMMKMNGDMNEMDMQMSNQTMDMNEVMYPEITDSSSIVTLNYDMLRSPSKTALSTNKPTQTLRFNLTGNMNRYVWSIDNKTVSETDKILIKKGENVKIILTNNTMMRHPMHLHGHFFRVLNKQGDHAPLKNVLDIMPMETDTIEFAATESGDWFFHCHILYHMMSGMGRIFSYVNSPPNPELPNPKKALKKLYADDREMHLMARVGLESNGSDGELMLANTRWKVKTAWHLGYHDAHGYESETVAGRYLGKMQWWYPYIGFDYHYKKDSSHRKENWFGQLSNKDDRHTIVTGIQYILPMLAVADARIDGDGKFRFQLSREDISLTSRLRLNFMINTDKEYMTGLRYIITKYISFSSHYDSDMGYGAGLTITY